MSPKSDLSTRLGRYATLTGGGAAMCMGAVGIATNASADVTTGTAGWVLGLADGDFFMSGQSFIWNPVTGPSGGGSFADQLGAGAFLRMNGFAAGNNNALGFSLYINTGQGSGGTINPGGNNQAGSFFVQSATSYNGVEWAAGSTFGTNSATGTVGIGNVLSLEGNGFMSSGTKYALFSSYPLFSNGWVEIIVDFTDNDNFSITIGDWAYQSVSSGPLAAGSTGDAPAVPGLGGLAALACGAAGVRSKRRRAVA